MKHTLILLACLSVVVLSLCGAMWIHAGAKEQAAQVALKQAAINAQHEAQAAKQKAAQIKEQDQAQAEISHLETECKNGVAVYNLLTTYQKTHAVKPDCSL